MSETRWTAGPWRVAKAHEMRGVNVIAGEDDFVCEVGFPAPHNPVEADAHLIAAAPDLHEALQWALTRIPKPTLIRGQNDSHVAQYSKAQAALAKARGEEPPR